MNKKKQYKVYLKSKEWKVKRQAAILYYHGRCRKCRSTKNIEVHHKTYRNIFHESLEDLQLLCNKCHRAYHRKQIKKNGKVSKYMRNPYYDDNPVTFYPKGTAPPVTPKFDPPPLTDDPNKPNPRKRRKKVIICKIPELIVKQKHLDRLFLIKQERERRRQIIRE